METRQIVWRRQAGRTEGASEYPGEWGGFRSGVSYGVTVSECDQLKGKFPQTAMWIG